MNKKELTELYNKLDERINSLQTQIVNHCSQHTLDRIVSYAQLGLMVIVILLLKFKIL